MRHQSRAKKRFVARKGTIDKLVDNYKHSWRQIFPQGANSADRDYVSNPRPLHGINIGMKIYFSRRNFMPASMTR